MIAVIEPGIGRTSQPMVFKIVARAQWEEACLVGSYSGSLDDERDGYIHLSSPHQVEGTLKKYFSRRGDLLLVAFESADLGSDLRWERSRGGDLFPHLYASLRPDLALWAKPLALDQDRHPTCNKAWLSC